jgi:hypothetical protein
MNVIDTLMLESKDYNIELYLLHTMGETVRRVSTEIAAGELVQYKA